MSQSEISAFSIESINAVINELVTYVWGTPIVIALLGVGILYTVFLGFIQFRGFKHAIDAIRGKYTAEAAAGQLTHFQALTTALSSTVGLGNIAGVAVAISYGGPGAIFWMVIAGMLGMATKYAEATLALKYRHVDENGAVFGGPMYYITKGLGPKWKPLAYAFAIPAAIGTFGGPNMFQSNQVASIFKANFSVDVRITGVLLAIMTAVVILGGIQRIGKVASKLIPFMIVMYMLGAFVAIALQFERIPEVLWMILHDAFSGTAAVGGFQGVVVKEVIIAAVRRSVFSNEAGMGTSAMAHSAAATKEPVREGTVALLEPLIDTMISFCTTTMVILLSGVWTSSSGDNGVVMTSKAFDVALPGYGHYFMPIAVLFFGYTTILSWSYYGEVAVRFLLGQKSIFYYRILFSIMVYVGAIWSLDPIISLSDFLFGFMIVPNLVALYLLFPDVKRETDSYYRRLKNGEFDKK